MDWSVILSSCIVAATTILSLFLKDFLQKKKRQIKSIGRKMYNTKH